MLCPICNKPVADGARFCGSCGAAVNLGGNSTEATIIRPAAAPSSAGVAAPLAGAATQWPRLFQRIKNILLSPKTEWPVIEREPTSIAELYKGYVIPLAALAALMSFVRMSVVGISMPFAGAFRTPLLSGLIYALVSFGFGLAGLFLVGLIINGLAPTFSGTRDQRQAMKTAAYAFTPAWLSSLLGLLPAFAMLLQLLAGIYGIYLLYLGLPQLMRSPRDKAVTYTAAVVICTILIGVIFGALSTMTGGFGGYGRFGAPHDTALSREQQQERAAAAVGEMIGGVLGTDEKGKQNLSTAINNLAQAGQKIEQEQKAAGTASTQPAAPASAATPANSTTTGVTADSAQSAVSATTGLLTALGGAMGGSHRVDPVDFHTLKGMLPDSLPGMQRTDAEGSSQQAMGVKSSAATATYKGPAGARAEIKISDISGVSGLLDAAGSLVQATNSESDTGYEKDTMLGGRSAHEKYDGMSKHGEISVIVVKRFAVEVTGDRVPMSTLEQYASNIDYARLEAMKDQGSQPR